MTGSTFEDYIENYFKENIRIEFSRQDIIYLALGICSLMDKPEVREEKKTLYYFQSIGRKLVDSVKVDDILPVAEEIMNEFLKKGLIENKRR